MAEMSQHGAALEKIRSEGLRREAIETNSKPHVVIVEVGTPRAKVKVLPPDRRSGGGVARFRFPKVAKSGDDHRVEETRLAIEKILGRPPERFFSTSGAFVVTATGKQIRHLADLPQVRAIWPNEKFGARS